MSRNNTEIPHLLSRVESIVELQSVRLEVPSVLVPVPESLMVLDRLSVQEALQVMLVPQLLLLDVREHHAHKEQALPDCQTTSRLLLFRVLSLLRQYLCLVPVFLVSRLHNVAVS